MPAHAHHGCACHTQGRRHDVGPGKADAATGTIDSAASAGIIVRMTDNLLRQLIRARSTPDVGELAAAEVIAAHFDRHGVECQLDHWEDNHANVVAHVKSTGERPALYFVCHLDVVSPGEEPWHHGPFDAEEVNGNIYGRGTADMKGGTAAAVAAICGVLDAGVELQGDIFFAATAGEETDSSGIVRLMRNAESLPTPAGIIIPEPTDFAVITAHRGLLWLEIATRGKAVHSSMPQRGINAIMSMKLVLDALERHEIACDPHPTLGQCSLSVNMIAGGEALNIVPDQCSIGVDIRTLPGQNHNAILHDLERLLPQIRTAHPQFDGAISVDRSVEAMETDADCPFVQTFCTVADVDLTNAIGFTTDAPHLVALGAPIVIYGPGKPSQCHQVNEHIAVADLHQATDIFKRAIHTFLT